MPFSFGIVTFSIFGSAVAEPNRTQWYEQECRDSFYDYAFENYIYIQKCYTDYGYRGVNKESTKPCVIFCVATGLGVTDMTDGKIKKEIYDEWLRATLKHPEYQEEALQQSNECFGVSGTNHHVNDGKCEKADELFRCLRKNRINYTC